MENIYQPENLKHDFETYSKTFCEMEKLLKLSNYTSSMKFFFQRPFVKHMGNE